VLSDRAPREAAVSYDIVTIVQVLGTHWSPSFVAVHSYPRPQRRPMEYPTKNVPSDPSSSIAPTCIVPARRPDSTCTSILSVQRYGQPHHVLVVHFELNT
jgi:hypothetical protein